MPDSADRRPPPRVSVVVPVHDGEAHVESAVRTVLRQSFEDLEVVLVDDGSTDRSAELVRRLAAAEPRVRAVHQPNRGLAAARNRGIEEARGELLAFLDQDDLWHRHKLALQVAFLDAHPACAMVSCLSALVDARGALLGWPFGVAARADAYRQLLECDFVSGGSVALVRRACLDAVGCFDPAIPVRADWDLWIRIARRHPVGTVPRVLVGYTRAAHNMSSDHARMAATGALVLGKAFAADPALPRRFRRQCAARDAFAVACFCLIDGRPRTAWQHVARSLSITPWPVVRSPRRWALLGALALATVLPARAFAAVFGVAARRIGLPPGAPFASLEELTPARDGSAAARPATART